MLIYFKVGNYKSIKDPIVLNFNAAAISEHTTSNIRDIDNLVLLKTILLYGHNAGGKSKILDALIFFRNFIISSATTTHSSDTIDFEPFRLSEFSVDKPGFFEASFILNKKKYRYGFEADKKNITKEWLFESKAKKEYVLFLRLDEVIQIDNKRFENATGLEVRTRKNALFLSVAAQWNVAKAQTITQWFSDIYTVHGLRDNRNFRNITIELLDNPLYSELIRKFIQKADLGIDNINVSEIPVKLPDHFSQMSDDVKTAYMNYITSNAKEILTIHKKYNSENKEIGTENFLLDREESEGTKKYFSLIGVLIKALLENRFVIIDEFDARLHTLLSKAILRLFNSPVINSNAQLLVASHDTALLDKNIMRRDQIYFVEKDQFGATNTTSLVEYKPRKESPYYKNYLDGRYGAIPIIDDLENLVADGQKEK